MSEEILLTQEGYDKLEAERDELVSVRRKEVSERLTEAISYGDRSENAEYDAAKNEQAELEAVSYTHLDVYKRQISDHMVTGESCSSEERQTAFTTMMEVALETAIK